MLPEFELITPGSLSEALRFLAQAGHEAEPLAGGTNLIVDMRGGRAKPHVLVDISHLPELHGIRRENGSVAAGGAVTIAELLQSEMVGQSAAALAQAAAVFANPLVRNRATLGGNLADGSPAADTAPALLALDATVDLTSQEGTRCLPLSDFFLGVRRTALKPGEVISAVRWPAARSGSASAFHKLGLRRADAISVVSAAVRIEHDPDGRCAQARIALGAVAPRPILVPAAQAALEGRPLTEATIREAAALSAEAATPIDDVRGSAAYRRRVTAVIVRRLLESL